MGRLGPKEREAAKQEAQAARAAQAAQAANTVHSTNQVRGFSPPHHFSLIGQRLTKLAPDGHEHG